MLRRLLPVVAMAVFGMVGAAWAASSSSHSIHVTLNEPTSVCGKVMPAGSYHFLWTENAKHADVTFEKNGSHKVVTEVQANVQERAKAYPHQELVLRTAKAGTQVLEEVRLRGHRDVLVFPAS
jgi:hypothetical protein